jgi:hypothetical protein
MPSTEASSAFALVCGVSEGSSEAGLTGTQQDGVAPSFVSLLFPIALTIPPSFSWTYRLPTRGLPFGEICIAGWPAYLTQRFTCVEQYIDVFQEAV